MAGHFDLARGVWFDEHAHPVPQLAWAAQGVLSVRALDRTWVLPPGLALWMPATLRHATGATTAADMLGIYITAPDCPISWDAPTVVAISPLARELLVYLLRDDLMLSSRTLAEALLFAQLHPVGDIHIDVPMPTDPRATAIAQALSAHPADPGSLEAWGREVGASARTLARIWAAETGIGFGQWRTRLRLQAALPLLAAGTAVNTVARRIGYQSASAFVAAFRREVGVPPASYFVGAG